MAKINVSVAKKKGGPDYSSTMYSLSTEVDVPIEGEQDYVDKVHALFEEVESQVDLQIKRNAPQPSHPTSRRDFWGSGGNGGNGNGGHSVPQDRDRSHAKAAGGNGGNGDGKPTAAPQQSNDSSPSTPKQVQFLFRLARKSGLKTQGELARWITENVGVSKTAYQLSKVECSKAIDILNGKEAKTP
jgi:hypothetical protein